MEGSHKHKCPECGFIWEHGDHNAGNDETHECPCGTMVWTRYHGGGTVDYAGCQKPRKSENGKPIIEPIDRQRSVLDAVEACLDNCGFWDRLSKLLK
jgi:hypothetical protein